jgi:hypothetical protein
MPQTNGYSAEVRGWLVANGHRLALAQVGPDHCVLRQPASLPPSDADILVEIDGQVQQSRVFLEAGISPDSNIVRFVAK